ncbi:MAG: anhydro-N-acetylmuramic acid kinase [Bacteroidales bacterium]
MLNPKDTETVRALGVMSGTSLDGVDLCLAQFKLSNQKWTYSIEKAKTFEYTKSEKEILGNAHNLSGLELSYLNAWYGKWIAEKINTFIETSNHPTNIIGSHGHTVFHNPSKGFSVQIGSGAHIAAITGIPCVCDFRMNDIARGGQGAPLVPIGDTLLFNNFDICLNIGGIANLSFNSTSGERVAYDICPANMALNHLAHCVNKEYDHNGEIGRKGKVNAKLLEQLNRLDFYGLKRPKSLGREWFEQKFLPLISNVELPTEDLLRTVYEHIAKNISESFAEIPHGKVLVTGGGAKNLFLTNLISSKCKNDIVIPNAELIDFKEALVFGFLAVLYMHQTPSAIATATGATSNSVGGCMYM